MLVKASVLPAQPRTAALLSCQKNIMPVSWHMPISREPFRYAVALRDENVTHEMLKHHGSFTLNFLPFLDHEKIDKAGRVHGNTVDKLAFCDLVSSASAEKGNLLLDDSDFIYECTIIDTYQNGDHTIFISDVTQIWIQDGRLPSPTLFLGRGRYTTTSSIVQLQIR